MIDLGDLDFERVEEILSTLNAEDVEKIQSMASQLFPSSEEKEKKQEKTEKKENSSFGFDSIPFDADSLAKIFSIMKKLQSQPEDNRIKLLNTLRPMLSAERRQRVDAAVQLLRLITVLPYFTSEL